MNTEDFDFYLPEHLIAQTPAAHREQAKLLVVDGDAVSHHHFYDIVDFLDENDVLVVNNTRVVAARLFGVKPETGAHVELLILKFDDTQCECLVGNAKVVKVGTELSFGEGLLKATCTAIGDEGIRFFSLSYEGIFLEILDTLGQMPLPPYIHERLEDKERYQTVYSKVLGSAAAPTAGLHFTPEILAALKAKGVEIIEVTLHVGLGTFRPVKVDDVHNHVMHSEDYVMSEASAKALNEAKAAGKRIVAVGTTSVRTLETVYQKFGRFEADASASSIFIYPGYEYQAVDAIITNFHLPKSTLIMLVAAFIGHQETLDVYALAVEASYRFFSFGDSMFLTHKKGATV